MKKFILTSLILFAGFFLVNLQAQTVPVLIQGQVTDVVTGAPIANHSVHITTDSTSPAFYYFNTVITDNAGHYSDVVNVPPNSQILFFIFTIDCNGMRHDAFGVSTNAPIINNFSICGTAGPQCHADFYVIPDSLTQFSFHFIDVSLPFPDTWAWDFGDGTTSSLQFPNHTYSGPGVYQVCLTISKGVPGTISFCTDTYCDNVFVDTLPNPCYNNFTFTINNLNVNFSGMANPPNSTYSWDFGDGTVGTGQNISHTYAGPGLYPVTLTTSSFIGCTFTSFQMVQLGGPGICDPMFMVMPVPGNSMTFDFIDISMGYPMSWSWDFGDGTTSTLQNPIHTYNAPGPYVICLTIVCDPNTQPSTYCDSIFVNGNPTGCNAKFYVYPDSTTNFAYYFQDASSPIPPDTWAWDFGDGTTANIPYPYHVFNAPGVYNVCLTITKGVPGTSTFCTDTYCKNVFVDSLQTQCYNNFQYVVNNLTVDFFGMAIPPNSSYTWDFGDGSNGVGQNVVHTYAAPGIYPVTLVTNDFLTGCSFTSTQTVLVSGNPSNCQAMFFHHPDSLNILGFHFMDVSQPIPDTWAWDFGDGTTSNIQNPYHVFNAPGLYQVCLTITKGAPGTPTFCTDTYCENVFIDSLPGSCFNNFQYAVNNLTVDFFGMANPPSLSYIWDFGDNTTGTGQNVSHTYAAPGLYPVTLTTTTPNGCTFTSTQMVDVSGNLGNCNAMFFHHPDSLNILGFHFIDVSTPIPDTWTWDFGDGTTANIPNPYHVYSAPGVYHVCLTITKGTPGTISFCTDTYCENVFVNSNPTGGKIQGVITMGFGFADHAKVFLIVFDPVANTLTALDTVYTQNNPAMLGYYEFLNVQPGTYLVKAALTPNSVSYADFMPTYYINTLWWDYGSDVIVNNQWVIADINLIAGSNPGGPGFIGGNVTQGANKLLGPGDAIPDVEILLLSMNDDPHLYTYSDVNGDYGFNNLAYGTYKIWAEVLDKTTIPVIVTIDANNPSITNIDLIVTSTGVTTSIDDNISAFVENVSDIYPNPVNDEMNVEVSLKQSSELQFEVFNQIGQIVYSKTVSESAGQHLVKINTSDFDGGVYSLRITTKDKAQIMRKFVKVD